MKKLNLTIVALVFLITTASAQNLAVFRARTSGQTLANTGNSIFIDLFNTSGGAVNSIAIPDSGLSPLVVSGTSTAEGALASSPGGNYLTFGGYNIARPYGSSLPASTATAVARGVGRLDLSGSFTLATTTTSQFGGSGTTSGGFRSVVTDGANNYWGVGTANAASGRSVYYFGNNVPANQVVASINGRVANVFNGSLYYATATTLSMLSGMPTTGPATPTLVLSTGLISAYDFAVNSANNIIYVADDGTGATGGIQKWTFGTSWTLAYTLSTGVAANGARGLAVDFSGANPVLYATTTDGSRIIKVTDTGAGSTASTLVMAPAGTAFRGLDFTQIPEPTTAVLLGFGLLAFCQRLRRTR